MNKVLSKLAGLLLEKSYIPGRVTLTSGRVSDYYFDCKQTALHPEGGYLLGMSLLQNLKESVQAIGGMTLGADPLVSAASVLSHIHNRPLPAFIVRKNPKGHGTNQYLEGLANVPHGAAVAIIEDVVTSGGSVLKACQRTADAGLHISQVLTVLDRQEGGAEALAEQGYTLESLFTKQSLFAAAGKEGSKG
jgi:orotate phosphoribosyltransferase